MSPHRTLLAGGWILSMDPAIGDLRRGDVLIEGEHIVAVAPHIETEAAERIDAQRMIVMPGFIDTHRHTWQTCVRHRYADIDPQIYFAEMLGAKGAAFRTEDVYAGTLLGAVSALDSGTTTMLDWSHVQNTPEHADAAILALRDAGIRGVFAHGWPLVEGHAWMFDSERGHPQDIRRLRSQYFSSDDQLLTLAMAGRGPEMARREVWLQDLRLARELDIRSTIHMGAYARNAPVRAIAQMHQAGVLGDDLTFVHCCFCGDDELAMMADAGVTASLGVHCELNAQGIGDIPFDRLLAAGIRPSLSGDTETKCAGDMFTQMRHAFAHYRSWMGGGHSKSANAPATLTLRDVLEFGTIAGAKATGLAHKTGSLTPGKQADLILVRQDDLNLTPVSDAVGAIVLAAHPGNVDSVYVAGRAVKRDGRMLHIDVDALRARAFDSQRHVLAAM
ncbi:cytosine/adenosine deaminase-related metal-dependent hydrolase [Variovorax boronicumulans]|uniref:Cytosine/adenosine deaminase-related metal-dependent hydrolase n=1 Tax=Variovorax boronicumulans TaxID=436515 RepID=A0AAW8DUC9_9BURK|nr:amidohydrolase family protein [Variovorax boronicumulans]MDP9877778.1 cytosine/adenosine deaminase-related metal-dependent hydrolase [Variovorax boronicumulans]MDP9923061.1 cytosine/adenosine deaminase-related metal-dependent hydrolase [Variovorax boronicumulans]